MNEISKRAIIEAVKKEYKEGREFCRVCRGGYYMMRIDVNTGTIWVDLYVCENDWTVYHSGDVKSLEYAPGYVDDVEQGYIDSAVELLTAAGWEVVDDAEK